MSEARSALFTTGEILWLTVKLVRASAVRALIALAPLAGVGLLIDIGYGGADSGALNFFLTALTLVMQFWLTKAILRERGYHSPDRVKFPAFFGLAILTGLGIIAGLVLLVVPGVILALRWSVSVPILVGSDEGVFGSMAHSWRETEGRLLPIFGALVAIYAPAMLVVGVGYFWLHTYGVSLPVAVAMNLVLEASFIAGWYASVAIWLLAGRPAGLSEVFE